MDERGKVFEFLVSTPGLTSFAAILIIVFKYAYSRLRVDPKLVKFAASLPGPPTLPFIGNTLDLFFSRADNMEWILECQKKYGSIFRIWIGKHLAVFLTDVNDLEHVFRNPRTSGKPDLHNPFQDIWGDGLCCTSMQIWKKTRKLQQSVYTNNVLPSYVPHCNEKIYGLVNAWKKFVDGPEFDAADHLPYLSFDIITKIALGVDVNARDKENMKFHECIRTGFDTSLRRMFQPWLHIKPICSLLLGKRIAETRNKMWNFTEHLVKDRLDQLKEVDGDKNTTPESSTVTPFLLAAYRCQLATGKETIFRDEVITILTGGTETVSITNTFCLLAIASNPDIQDKLYDEIFDVFGDGDRPADQNDLLRLPYLDQVVKEAVRRYPLGTLLYKTVEEDTQIGSHIFPAGTAVLIPILRVHMNPDYYPNPEKFDPENFAPHAVEKRPKLAFLSFGAGTRNCIGMNFGYLEVKLTLIALLRAFHFRTAANLDDLRVILGFNTRSAEGCKMSITARDRRPSYARDVNEVNKS